MKQGETVSDFRDKLNILLMGAENSLREDKGAAYSDDMMVPIKGTAVDIFIRGLPSHLSTAIDAIHPVDLDATFKEAVRIESRIRSKMLPESSSHYHSHRYEDNELSANVSRNNTRYMTIIAPQPIQYNLHHHRSCDGRNQQSSQPAFVGYMDQPDNQPPGPNAYYDEFGGNPDRQVVSRHLLDSTFWTAGNRIDTKEKCTHRGIEPTFVITITKEQPIIKDHEEVTMRTPVFHHLNTNEAARIQDFHRRTVESSIGGTQDYIIPLGRR